MRGIAEVMARFEWVQADWVMVDMKSGREVAGGAFEIRG